MVIAFLWPHLPWFSEVLQLLVSALIQLQYFPNLLTQVIGKFQHQNLPTLALHANNQLEIKFSQNVADCVSKSRRASTQKVYDAKWVVYSKWCHRKKVNLVSAPVTVIADFLYTFFLRKSVKSVPSRAIAP